MIGLWTMDTLLCSILTTCSVQFEKLNHQKLTLTRREISLWRVKSSDVGQFKYWFNIGKQSRCLPPLPCIIVQHLNEIIDVLRLLCGSYEIRGLHIANPTECTDCCDLCKRRFLNPVNQFCCFAEDLITKRNSYGTGLMIPCQLHWPFS